MTHRLNAHIAAHSGRELNGVQCSFLEMSI